MHVFDFHLSFGRAFVRAVPRLALIEFLAQLRQRLERLRQRLRTEAPRRARTLEDAWRLAGQVYVESVGTTVDVINHETEFFYIPSILPARDRLLHAQRASRQRVYDGISRQLGDGRRVLVIGAGGDVTPLNSFRTGGHEVLATDFAEDVVEVLRKKAGIDAFACDLVHLDEVIPEPVDVIVGNATLGYVAPSKLARVVKNIAAATNVGDVFTFDLMPHGHYFNMALGLMRQTVANESAPSPQVLLDHVRKHGAARGIAAATLQSMLTSMAVNMAVVALLKRRFEAEGFMCSTGEYLLRVERGGDRPSVILRVARDDRSILAPLEEETQYSEPVDALRRHDLSNLGFYMPYLDRASGEELAREFGIHQDRREDPWLVLAYLKNHQPDPRYYEELLPGVIAALDPNILAERINLYVEGRPYVPPTPLPAAVLFDQYTRKLALSGDDPNLDKDQADYRIDLGYQRAASDPTITVTELGRPPRAVPVSTQTKVGRNELCPCGSGKKFKKCHGQ